MAFRFRMEVARCIRKTAARNYLSQTRVLEILVMRHAKELSILALPPAGAAATDSSFDGGLASGAATFSNSCERGMAEGHFRPTGYDRSEQNPQVPLASEDASLRQVPGNAETAVGHFAVRPPCSAPASAPAPCASGAITTA